MSKSIENTDLNFFYKFPGLAKQEFDRDHVKLHMTLINTKNSVDDDNGQMKYFKYPTFDARHLLENYGDFDFGTQEISEIHLAIMKTTDESNGFYKSSIIIQF